MDIPNGMNAYGGKIIFMIGPMMCAAPVARDYNEDIALYGL